MNPRKTFIAVRPYRESIRTRVFALLERLGYEVPPAVRIAPDTSEDDVIATVRAASRPDLLLVPYNAQRAPAGAYVDGLGLAVRLRGELPELSRVPMLVPVSQVGLGGFHVRLQSVGTHAIGVHHVLKESELDDLDALALRLGQLGI